MSLEKINLLAKMLTAEVNAIAATTAISNKAGLAQMRKRAKTIKTYAALISDDVAQLLPTEQVTTVRDKK